MIKKGFSIHRMRLVDRELSETKRLLPRKLELNPSSEEFLIYKEKYRTLREKIVSSKNYKVVVKIVIREDSLNFIEIKDVKR